MFGGLRQGLTYKEGFKENITGSTSNTFNDSATGSHGSLSGTVLRPTGKTVGGPSLDNPKTLSDCGKVSEEQTLFYKKLQDYNKTMTQIYNTLNTANSKNSLIGTNVIVQGEDGDDDFYYINKFGYPNRYKSSEEFFKRGQECRNAGNPTSAIT